jgi:PTH2 family peptidyl-tRNA hydrolase
MKQVRQVIIMRTDLDMPVGKMIAQGAHASEGASLKQLARLQVMDMELWENLSEWKSNGKTKIVVGIDSEEKLLNLVLKATGLGINAYVVTDNAKTHFDKPTITCACLGVDTKENLDKVTKRLRLLK